MSTFSCPLVKVKSVEALLTYLTCIVNYTE